MGYGLDGIANSQFCSALSQMSDSGHQ